MGLRQGPLSTEDRTRLSDLVVADSERQLGAQTCLKIFEIVSLVSEVEGCFFSLGMGPVNLWFVSCWTHLAFDVTTWVSEGPQEIVTGSETSSTRETR